MGYGQTGEERRGRWDSREEHGNTGLVGGSRLIKFGVESDESVKKYTIVGRVCV